MSGFIQKLFTSRDNNANAANYVGEQDRIWWNPDTNAFYHSDGNTPGGQPVGIAGNASIGGSNTQIQYNSSGSFAGSSNLKYDYANAILYVPETLINGNLEPISSNTFTLGTPVNRWGNTYIGPNSLFIQDSANSNVNAQLNVSNGILYINGVTALATSTIVNGNSSIVIDPNANINFSAAGGPDVLIVTNQGTNVAGYLNVVGDFTVEGNTVQTGILQVGNITISGNTVSDMVSNGNLSFTTTGSNSAIIFNTNEFNIKTTTNPNPVFQVAGSGEVFVLSPTFDANTGAVSIVGSSDGSYVPPAQTGGMLHVTGQPGTASRVFNDGANNYALYSGRRYNGTSAAPTQVLANDVIARFSAGAYNSGNAFPTTGVARFDLISSENQTATNQGTRIEVWTTPVASNVIAKQLTFSSNGITFIDGSSQNTAAIPLSYIGVANGVASLNNSGKIPTSQLPAGAVVYIGAWDAYLNTPTLGPNLPNGVLTGWEYSVSNGGTQNIGDGPVTFYAGDYVIYNGSTWDRIPGSGSVVASFNTRTGAVTLSSSDVTTALGYTPYNGSTNPNGYVNSAGAAAAAPVQSFNTRSGAVTLQSSDVTTALTSGSLTNAKLANSNVIIGNTTVSLGSTANTLTGLTGVTATTFTGNLTGTASTANSVAGANVTGTVANATYATSAGTATSATTAGTVTTAAQPNITSVGNLTSLTVTGNTTSGNIITGGIASITGNTNVGNLGTSGLIVATGNVTGGNLTTAGIANIGTLAVTGNTTVTGNISAGNLNITANGVITTPRIAFNDGGVRSVTGGTAQTLNFNADSMVLWYVPTGDTTVTLANYTSGSVIKLIVRMGATGRNIAMGVADANNSTTGTTTITGHGGGALYGADQAVILTYSCVDGTAANTYVQVSYV